jgi:hypothetical protein
MAAWTSAELNKIGRAEELDLASMRRDGSLRNPVTIWVVRSGDDIFVRCMNGRKGAWFRGILTRHEGHIGSAGIDKDVTFVEEHDAAVNAQVDIAYHAKYDRYGQKIVGTVVNPDADESTLKLVPRGPAV